MKSLCTTCKDKVACDAHRRCYGYPNYRVTECIGYEPKDEPQTYVINPQEPTNDDKCFECDDFFTCDGQCDEVEDEPQTERSSE